jgi:outer membrane lipoprotein SlyB
VNNIKKIFLISPIIAFLLLSACVQKPGQDVYKAGEVGVSHAVEFGTVLNVREVKITADNHGEGALAGAGAGAGGGSYAGGGSGSAWAAAGGAIAGAIIGNSIQENVGAGTGYEYTLEMRNGDVKTIVQQQIEGEKPFKPGDKVMLQYCDAGNEHVKRCAAGKDFQRLLPVTRFPSGSAKPKYAKTVPVEEQ